MLCFILLLQTKERKDRRDRVVSRAGVAKLFMQSANSSINPCRMRHKCRAGVANLFSPCAKIFRLAQCATVGHPWSRASASQSVDLEFIPLVESYQKTLKNGIHSFPAWRWAFKGCCGEPVGKFACVFGQGT